MAGGESGRRALAGIVHGLHEDMAWPVAPRHRETLPVCGEVCPDIREYTFHGAICPYGMEIILWPCNREEVKYDVEQEERCDEYERRTQEIGPVSREIHQRDDEQEEIIGSIAEVHQLREPPPRHLLREEERRLAMEDFLLPCGDDRVKIRQDAVEGVCVGIPLAEEQYLRQHSDEHHQRAWKKAVEPPEGQHGSDKLYACPHKGRGVGIARRAEHDHSKRHNDVEYDCPLMWKKAADGGMGYFQ